MTFNLVNDKFCVYTQKLTMKTAKKSRYHHGDLRAELVRVGRRLLETETNPSLRAIARAADVSHGAPVHHFPTWAHLLAACAADGFRELSDDLRAASTPERAPDETLIAMCIAYLAFARRNPVVFRLMFNRHALTERTEEFRRDANMAYTLLQDAIRALDPAMPDDRFDTLINAVWALVHGMSVLDLENQICRTAEDKAETATFLRHGIARLIAG